VDKVFSKAFQTPKKARRKPLKGRYDDNDIIIVIITGGNDGGTTHRDENDEIISPKTEQSVLTPGLTIHERHHHGTAKHHTNP